MTWRSAVLAILLSAAPAVAHADDPGAPNSTYPQHIRLIGHEGGGTPDPRGRFTVTSRDLANNPIADMTVTIDLSGASDLRLCAAPALSGLVVNCPARTVSGVTSTLGEVEFAIFGWAVNNGDGTGSGLGAARIRACTQPECMPGTVMFDAPISVSAFDQTGGDGVSSMDLSRFLADFGAGGYLARSDHDHSGFVGITDFAVLLQSLGDGRSSVGCAGPAGGTCP